MKRKMKQMVAFFAAAALLLEAPFSSAVTVRAEEADQSAVCMTVSENEAVPANEAVSQNEVAKDVLLNFFYIEKSVLTKDEKQSLVASVDTQGETISDATLTIENTLNKEQMAVKADRIQDGLISFLLEEGLQKGVYRVKQLEVLANKLTVIDFEAIEGMKESEFAVDCELLNQQNLIPLEELAGESDLELSPEMQALENLEMNVVDLRDDKNADAASDKVANAIKSAKDQMEGQSLETDAEIQAEGVTAGSLVIVLDPGHDDSHCGAARNGLKEENLTLKIAQYCKAYLEANYTNVVVHMTRTSGTCPHPGTTSTVDNGLRVADAKNVGADIYVSFHIDSTAYSTTAASGSTVYYPNANYNSAIGMSGASLATMISQQLAAIGIKNNGIRIRNSENNTLYPDGSLADYLGVIRQSKENGITAVLIEHAYINNPSDAAYLANEDNLRAMGQADAIGIGKAYSLSNEEVEYDADDLTISEIDGSNGSFKITLTGATPVNRIKDIKFKVTPTDETSKSYLYTAEADKKTKGKYTITGNVANHGNCTGKYKVIAYAYDAAGRKAQLRSTTFTIEEASLDTTGMKLTTKLNTKQTQATITLTGDSGAQAVSFKVYSQENGKDDIKTYTATKLSNGSWQAKVNVQDHKSAGVYTVNAYSTSYFGTTKNVKTATFTVEGPTAERLRVKKINLDKGTFQLITEDLDAPSGIKEVKMRVKNLSGSRKAMDYTAKKTSSGEYAVTVDMKNHDYRMGRYYISATATDQRGFSSKVYEGFYDFGAATNTITAKLKAKQTKLSMTATGLGINTSIESVKFRVYNSTTSSKKKDYLAKKNSKGVWSATSKISDIGQAGTYKITTYVKRKGKSYSKVGQVKTVSVNDISGGLFKTKAKNNKTYLYVTGIDSKCDVEKVQIKAWPSSKKSASYVYTAKELDDGEYRVDLNTLRHGGKIGEYRYIVTVTLKNGVTKDLIKGRFETGKSTSSMNEDGYYTISGTSSVTIDQMVAYYKKYATYPSFYAMTEASTIKKFCTIYYNECQAEGIKAEVAFAQAMKETNFLRYTGDVDITQYNFAGIGATGGGAKGNSFASVTIGIRAQIQHLKAYANSDPLVRPCVDPRFIYVSRETAPYVEWLGIPDNPYGKGWATAQNYGSSLLNMIRIMKEM